MAQKGCGCFFVGCKRPLRRYRVVDGITVTWEVDSREGQLARDIEDLRFKFYSISSSPTYDDGAGVIRCIRCGIVLRTRGSICVECEDYVARQEAYRMSLGERILQAKSKLDELLRARLGAKGKILRVQMIVNG